jgi:hypothetical protein
VIVNSYCIYVSDVTFFIPTYWNVFRKIQCTSNTFVFMAEVLVKFCLGFSV